MGWAGWKDYQSGPCNSECNEPNDVSGRKLDGSTTVPDFLLLLAPSFFTVRIRVFDGLLTPPFVRPYCVIQQFTLPSSAWLLCVCVCSSTSIIRLVVCLELRKNLLPKQQQQPKKKTYWIFVFPFIWVCNQFRRQADEVLLLETAIRQRSEQQRKTGAELDATCQLCLKTKFADGLGHACHYCNVRCCARCGGKVALRSSKVPSIYPPAYCSLSPIYLFSLSLSLGLLYIFAPVSTLFNRWLAHGCFTCASAVLIASSLHLFPAFGSVCG